MPLWPEDGIRWPIGEEAACPGIYLFCTAVDDESRAFYFGEANHVADRIREHLSCYLAGKYWLYDEQELSKGNLKPTWDPSPQTEKVLEQYEKLVQKMRAMLQKVQIYFARVHAEKHVLRRIESALISSLRGTPQTTRFLENHRLSVAQYRDHVPIEIICESPIFQMPRLISA